MDELRAGLQQQILEVERVRLALLRLEVRVERLEGRAGRVVPACPYPAGPCTCAPGTVHGEPPVAHVTHVTGEHAAAHVARRKARREKLNAHMRGECEKSTIAPIVRGRSE